MTATAEQELLLRVKRGDQGAMAVLLQQHQRRLYNVCLRMVSNRDDAAELTQDVMVKIVQHIGDYKGDAALTTWMIRIAMNHCLSHLRKRKLRHTLSLDAPASPSRNGQAGDGLGGRLRDREPSPHARVEQQEQLERLQRAIASLEEDFRSVLVLRDIEEMDYQQIAQVLELPAGTVKSRLFRARLALREQMLEQEHDASSDPSDAGQEPGGRREVKHG